MLADFFHALRRGPDQLRYFRHTYSPFSPWREQIAQVTETAGTEASRYGVQGRVDPRRAYQVARMVVADRHGEHLVDLVPDAYLEFSPPSAAGFHLGKRSYDAPDERRRALRRHPQTLAFLMCPPALARAGLGGSRPGGIGPIAPGESLELATVVARLREQAKAKVGDGELRAYAENLQRLAAGKEETGTGGEKAA